MFWIFFVSMIFISPWNCGKITVAASAGKSLEIQRERLNPQPFHDVFEQKKTMVSVLQAHFTIAIISKTNLQPDRSCQHTESFNTLHDKFRRKRPLPLPFIFKAQKTRPLSHALLPFCNEPATIKYTLRTFYCCTLFYMKSIIRNMLSTRQDRYTGRLPPAFGQTPKGKQTARQIFSLPYSRSSQ